MGMEGSPRWWSTLLVAAVLCVASCDGIEGDFAADSSVVVLRKLNQALVALDASPSPGLPGAGAGGGAPAGGGNGGPMGGGVPAQTTGPSGIAGPTVSTNRTFVETVSPSGLDTVMVTQRRTMGSLRCRLPIYYEGQLLTDCIDVDGVEKCAVRGGKSLRKCSPNSNPKVTPLPALLAANSGSDGGNGSLCNLGSSPFQMTPCVGSYACIATADGPLVDSGVGFCGSPDQVPQPPATVPSETPVGTPAVPESPPPEEPVIPAAPAAGTEASQGQAAGEAAAPIQEGLTSTDALVLDPAEEDLNALEGVYIPQRTTARGTRCRLPVVYKGNFITDCQPLDGKSARPQCFTRELRYLAYCSNATDYTTVTLASMLAEGEAGDGQQGAMCSLSGDSSSGPACGQGLMCTELDAAPLQGTDIGYCEKGTSAPPAGASVVQVQAGAQAPGPVSSEVSALAPNVDAAAQDQVDSHVAEGTVAAAAPEPSIPTMSVANRVTVGGERCRLPLVFGSNLLLDCISMSGKDAPPQCFTLGIAKPQQCATNEEYSSTKITDLLEMSNGTDGYTGSLCKVTAGQNNSTAVEVTGTCSAGLTCKPLTGPLAGSGIGFCTLAPISNMSKVEDFMVTRRTSIDGVPCRLPLIQGSNLLLDCVSLNNSIPMCFTGDSLTDPPRPCAPARPGTRVSFVDLIKAGQGMDEAEGSICTALTTAKPDSPENQGYKAFGCAPGLSCLAIGGPFNGTEYGFCKRGVALEVQGGTPPPAPDPASVKFALRSTTLGSNCRLPIIYKGRLVTDCQPLTPGASGGECLVKGSEGPQPCNQQGAGGPMVQLATWLKQGTFADKGEGALCVLPAAGAASPCATGLLCSAMPPGTLDTTEYGYCTAGSDAAPGPVPQPVDKMMVATRTTTSGIQCRLPLYYQGQLMLDCQDVNGTESCVTSASSALEPCSPKSEQFKDVPLAQFLAEGLGSDGSDGSICPLAPLPGQTQVHSVCLPGLRCNGARTGLLAGSGFGYCSTGSSAASTAGSKGLNDIIVAQRNSSTGKPCRLPIIHQGELITDCAAMDGGTALSCFVEGGTLEACLDDGIPQPVRLGDLLASEKGADGQAGSLCLPRGTTLARNASALPSCDSNLTCVTLEPPIPGIPSGYGYCNETSGTTDGTAAELPASALPAAAPSRPLPGAGTDSIIITPRLTTTQMKCRLPVVFQGKLVTDCMAEGGLELCFIEGLEKTATCGPTMQTNTTLTELLASGTASDGGEGALCQLSPPPSGSSLPCANLASSCVKFEDGPLVGTSFGYCSSAGYNGSSITTPTGYLASLMLANRTTLDGAPCRLPLVHMGVLYTDCMHVNDVLRCYVLNDSGPPRDCAASVPGAPEVSASALIAANRSLDGLEGSLCTLGALGDKNGNVFNCADSLSCREFPGPLKSAGYGYCEVGLPEQASAGALYVAPPAPSRKQCGPRCIGGALIGSVAAIFLAIGIAYLCFRRPHKGPGAQPFGGAFSRFNNAPTGARPISSLDVAVNGSLHSTSSNGRGSGGMSTLPPEGHMQTGAYASPFAQASNGSFSGSGGGGGAAKPPSTQLSNMARAGSARPPLPLAPTASLGRAQSMSKWAQSRQGSLISPQFLDQYVAPDAPARESEKKA